MGILSHPEDQRGLSSLFIILAVLLIAGAVYYLYHTKISNQMVPSIGTTSTQKDSAEMSGIKKEDTEEYTLYYPSSYERNYTESVQGELLYVDKSKLIEGHMYNQISFIPTDAENGASKDIFTSQADCVADAALYKSKTVEVKYIETDTAKGCLRRYDNTGMGDVYYTLYKKTGSFPKRMYSLQATYRNQPEDNQEISDINNALNAFTIK